jgi:L-lactate dehydrogenase complex protein LldE
VIGGSRLVTGECKRLNLVTSHYSPVTFAMRIGLFIPCYVDQLYPRVGVAALRLLEHFGAGTIEFPREQTCCGQPMANAGCYDQARPVAEQFVALFRDYDYIVGPSGSCVAMVRKHYHGLVRDETALEEVASKTYELCEFLVDVLKVEAPRGRFPHRVGIHQSCHGLRELELGRSSERAAPPYNKVGTLLGRVEGLQLIDLERPDECCGFGGTFSVFEEAVSCMMGQDRIADHQRGGAEVITAVDMSCLMHLDGLIRREKKPLRVLHVAELLCEAIGIRSE